MLPACLACRARVHIVQTKASNMPMGSIQRQEQYGMKDSDAWRLWGVSSIMFIFPLLSGKSAENIGGHGKKRTSVAITGRIGGRPTVYTYSCLYRQLVRSLLRAWLVSMRKQLNEKNFPNLSCALAIEVFPNVHILAVSFSFAQCSQQASPSGFGYGRTDLGDLGDL